MELKIEYFGPLREFIEDDSITDIDFNGKELWLTDTDNKRYPVAPQLTEAWLNEGFVEQFSQRIANLVSVQFNRQHPELEAESEELRVTILHESAARSGRCISIRKTPPVIRMKAGTMLQTGYAGRSTMAFLINCVLARFNLTFCGMPGVGKTECLKFFSSFIPAEDRVITIEDTMEIRYGRTNPDKDCVELKVQEKLFDYTAAIKASLRLNPRWIMLSEARSREVKYLLEGWSTGVSGMTTLHTNHVKNIPDRILNMMENRVDADRLENDIYRAMDIGVLICRRQEDDGRIIRFIDQVCFFHREEGQNRTIMLVSSGRWCSEELPQALLERFAAAGIEDPLHCSLLDQALQEEGA